MARSPKVPSQTSKSGLQNIAMVERVVKVIIESAFEEIATDLAFLDRLFWRLESSERAILKQYLKTEKVTVVHGYARRGMKMPLIAVAVANESDGQPVLGDLQGRETDEYQEFLGGPSAAVDVFGTDTTTALQIWIYAPTPDVCQYLYKIARVMLKSARDELLAMQVLPGAMSGGDVVPREDLLPDFVFARMIQWQLSGPETFVVEPKFWKKVQTRVHAKLSVNT